MRHGLHILAIALLAACASVNAPVNTARQDIAAPGPERFIWPDDGDPTTFIALAFSGGGHRASAYAYGILKELDGISAPDGQRLSDKVVAVSGASGGAVTAAWFGLSRRHGLDRFHDRYLLADAEQYMATAFYNPATIAAALGGGANDRTTYARFVDERLFEGARFADLGKGGLANTWINATDIAHKMPFVFNAETLRALCTDLAELPLSEAIAASTAFPLAFSPVVLEAHGPACQYEPSRWVVESRKDCSRVANLMWRIQAVRIWRILAHFETFRASIHSLFTNP